MPPTGQCHNMKIYNNNVRQGNPKLWTLKVLIYFNLFTDFIVALKNIVVSNIYCHFVSFFFSCETIWRYWVLLRPMVVYNMLKQQKRRKHDEHKKSNPWDKKRLCCLAVVAKAMNTKKKHNHWKKCTSPVRINNASCYYFCCCCK